MMEFLPPWLITALLAFIAVHLLLSLIYVENWLYLRKARLKHYTFLQGFTSNNPEDQSRSDDASVWLGARIEEIKRRIFKLGLNSPVHPHVAPVGYGQLLKAELSVLDNLLLNNIEVQEKVRSHLSDACGYSLVVACRHLNPIYWLETLIFLPKILAEGVGVESEKAAPIVQLMQLVYFLLGIYLLLIETGLIDLFGN